MQGACGVRSLYRLVVVRVSTRATRLWAGYAVLYAAVILVPVDARIARRPHCGKVAAATGPAGRMQRYVHNHVTHLPCAVALFYVRAGHARARPAARPPVPPVEMAPCDRVSHAHCIAAVVVWVLAGITQLLWVSTLVPTVFERKGLAWKPRIYRMRRLCSYSGAVPSSVTDHACIINYLCTYSQVHVINVIRSCDA